VKKTIDPVKLRNGAGVTERRNGHRSRCR